LPGKACLLIKYPGDQWVDVGGIDIYQRNSTNEKFIADIDIDVVNTGRHCQRKK
jgi:hypothetical protein